MWKGDHRGREVAVKVIRTYTKGDLQKVVGVSHSTCSRAGELTESCAEVLQRGGDVEGPSASKYTSANRGYDDRESVRDDIGLDGERKHQ